MVNDACGGSSGVVPEPEEIPIALGRFYDARAGISGGVRILLRDTYGPFNLAARVTVGSRRFFGAGVMPSRTAAAISAGVTLLWFPLRER